MTKLLAALALSHFSFDGVEYTRDEDGHFNIDHPAHVDSAVLLGAEVFDEDLHGQILGRLHGTEMKFNDDEGLLAAKDQQIEEKETTISEQADEIARLREQLAAATATPAGGENASGDTSSSTGGGSETSQVDPIETSQVDPIAAALALNPNFDAMSRDDMVVWLKGIGISVPVSISKENARKAIDDAVSAHASKEG